MRIVECIGCHKIYLSTAKHENTHCPFCGNKSRKYITHNKLEYLTCTKCKNNKEIKEFIKRKDSRFGIQLICKKCLYTRQNKHATDKYNRDPEFRKKYLLRKSKWRREHNYKNPKDLTKQKIAYNKIKYAVSLKKIIKPKKCEYCFEEKELHAHHIDYDRPLIVFWLCAKCHKEIHRRSRYFQEDIKNIVERSYLCGAA